MLERRKAPRRRMVLPVKVSIDQSTHLAHTIDITGAGARLGGLRAQLQPGTLVDLQRGSRKAKFRIMWFQQMAANEAQIGVECLEPLDKFWGVDLTERDKDSKKDLEALMSLLTPKPAV